MSCPICTCPVNAVFFRKGANTLLICQSCRHVWWDRFPPESEIREYYGVQYTRTHQQESTQAQSRDYYVQHLQHLLHLVGKTAGETWIADYGCSIPVLLIEARNRGFQFTLGVDYCEESRRYGAERDIRIIAPEGLDEVPGASLDIVRFSHALEHSIDPAEVLTRLLPKIRPGGLVYITQPNSPVFLFGPSPHDLKDSVYPEHLHFFSPISLLELAARVGLEVSQFFTHQNEELVLSTYQDALDLDYARQRLASYEHRGEQAANRLGNYPCYAGENSVLYAYKARPKGRAR